MLYGMACLKYNVSPSKSVKEDSRSTRENFPSAASHIFNDQIDICTPTGHVANFESIEDRDSWSKG